MRGAARSPGACGELVQGIVDGDYFLITCPIKIYTYAAVNLRTDGIFQGPREKSKALAAVKMTLELMDYRLGATLEIRSFLPPGKGLASSTADVTGAAVAAAAAVGEELTLEEIKKIAIAIEPSDGTFLPGIALFDHIGGRRWEYLGPPPQLSVLVVDPGGTVDTLAFNSRPDLQELNKKKEGEVRQAFELVRKGLALGRAEDVARGATISALANQKIIYKPEMERILEISMKCGAIGVNTAHSGTVLGVLYRPHEADPGEIEKKIKKIYPYVRFIRSEITGGGVETYASSEELPEYGCSR